MTERQEKIATILGILLGLITAIGIGSLIFWGIGNLIIYVFNISYNWTILHGLACQLVYMLFHRSK
jgi:Na+/proline symporter